VHLTDIASIGPANRTARRRERRDPRLAACAHAFGYRGHCLTKSRRYSTTFRQLRADREAFVHAQILARSTDATQRALAGAAARIVTLAFDGVGHVTTADAYLAAQAAAEARERRLAARLERQMAIQTGRGR
jgi:Replication initiator protein, pSAM2